MAKFRWNDVLGIRREPFRRGEHGVRILLITLFVDQHSAKHGDFLAESGRYALPVFIGGRQQAEPPHALRDSEFSDPGDFDFRRETQQKDAVACRLNIR